MIAVYRQVCTKSCTSFVEILGDLFMLMITAVRAIYLVHGGQG